MKLNKEFLHQKYIYKDGNLFLKRTNKKVGSPDKDGYLKTQINRMDLRVHRIIFMMFYGYLPTQVDHIDGNPQNNKIENLRPANNSENGLNAKKPKNNTSGVKGVHWHKTAKKWQVMFTVNSKRKSFGYFEEIELAELVCQEAREKYHGEFARHE